MAATDVQILDLIRRSLGYRLIDPRDKTKVEKALRGDPSVRPSSLIGQAAWELAKRIASHVPPPPPPPPAFVKVAPITVTQEGGSDQRVCLFQPDGSLRPGVTRMSNGQYTDESGARYASDGDGLEESGVRTKLPTGAFGLATARALDGRSACQCAPSGDPTKNTGSWTV